METRDVTPAEKVGSLGASRPPPTPPTPATTPDKPAVDPGKGAGVPAPAATNGANGHATHAPALGAPAASSGAAAEAEVASAEPEKPKPPKEPEEGKFMAQLRARESRLQQDKQAFARDQAAHKAEREQLARDRAVIQTYAQERQLAQQDPLQYLTRVARWTPDQIAARLLNGGKAVPGEGDRALQVQVAQLTKAVEEERAARAQTAQDERNREELATFVKFAAEGKDKWPLAAKMAADKHTRFLRLAQGVLTASGRTDLQDDEILDRLEEELSEITGTVSGKQPTAPRSTAQSTTALAANPPPASTNPSSTLTVQQRLDKLKAEGALRKRHF